MRIRSAAQRLNNVRRRSARVAFSQEGEDLIIERLTAGWGPSTYIDVGAHHPFRFSNTALLYQRGWRGVNVDVHDEFLRLFRKARPKDVNVRAAIGGSAGTLTYFVFRDSAFNTLDAETANDHVNLRGAELIKQQEVQVIGLQELLELHVPDLRRPGLLTVDVEGLDVAVLSGLDFDRIRPRIVCAEDTGGSIVENSPLMEMMIDRGYSLRGCTVNSRIFTDL